MPNKIPRLSAAPVINTNVSTYLNKINTLNGWLVVKNVMAANIVENVIYKRDSNH